MQFDRTTPRLLQPVGRPTGPPFSLMAVPAPHVAPRTIVYVDGFNLYYGALKNTPCKWLDLEKYFSLLRQGDDIRVVRYFTALVNRDPRRTRQQAYLAALATRRLVETILGRFKQKTVACACRGCVGVVSASLRPLAPSASPKRSAPTSISPSTCWMTRTAESATSRYSSAGTPIWYRRFGWYGSDSRESGPSSTCRRARGSVVPLPRSEGPRTATGHFR